MARKSPASIAQIVARVVEVALPIIITAVTQAVTERITRKKHGAKLKPTKVTKNPRV